MPRTRSALALSATTRCVSLASEASAQLPPGATGTAVASGVLNRGMVPSMAATAVAWSILLAWHACAWAGNLFSSHTDYDASRSTSAVAIGDLNNDGFPDLVAVHRNTD